MNSLDRSFDAESSLALNEDEAFMLTERLLGLVEGRGLDGNNPATWPESGYPDLQNRYQLDRAHNDVKAALQGRSIGGIEPDEKASTVGESFQSPVRAPIYPVEELGSSPVRSNELAFAGSGKVGSFRTAELVSLVVSSLVGWVSGSYLLKHRSDRSLTQLVATCPLVLQISQFWVAPSMFKGGVDPVGVPPLCLEKQPPPLYRANRTPPSMVPPLGAPLRPQKVPDSSRRWEFRSQEHASGRSTGSVDQHLTNIGLHALSTAPSSLNESVASLPPTSPSQPTRDSRPNRSERLAETQVNSSARFRKADATAFRVFRRESQLSEYVVDLPRLEHEEIIPVADTRESYVNGRLLPVSSTPPPPLPVERSELRQPAAETLDLNEPEEPQVRIWRVIGTSPRSTT